MRKSGLATLLIILAIFFAISYILTDAFFESLIEDLGTDAVGAKVEIDGFSFSIFGPDVHWDRLQVTDPNKTMQNMLETGFCEFNMEFWPLLRGKFVIENFQLSGLQQNTKRETDGKIDKPKKSKGPKDNAIERARTQLKKETKSSSGINLSAGLGNVNADSIIAILDLRTPARIDSTKKALEENFEKWQDKLAETDPESDVNRLSKQAQSIDIKKIKDLKSFQSALKTINEVQSSVDSLNDAYKEARNEFNSDYKSSSGTLGEIDDWIKEDYKRALSKAKLPDFSAQNIGKILFGDNIVNQFNEYLGYVATARTHFNKLSSGNDKEPSPPRFKGQDIYFSSANARPDFWLQNMSIDGKLNEEMPLGGSLTNVTTDPKMIGKPVNLNIKGASKTRNYSLNGELNYLDSIPKESFALNYSGIALNGMALSKSALFPNAIKEGKGNVDATLKISGNMFNGKIEFNAGNIIFDYGENKASGKLASIVRDVFNNTKTLRVSVVIKGKASDLVFAVKSNLDDALSKAFKATANKEIEAAKQKIRKKIDDQVAKKKAEAEKIIAENRAKLEAQLEKYQKKIDTVKEEVNKQKKKIEDEKNKVGDKLKNKLKDIF
jgi:uncharacterized protein (TIGR03545 family)